MCSKMYEAMNASSQDKQSEAMIIGLESKNQQLRDVIAYLYTHYQEDRKKWENQV